MGPRRVVTWWTTNLIMSRARWSLWVYERPHRWRSNLTSHACVKTQYPHIQSGLWPNLSPIQPQTRSYCTPSLSLPPSLPNYKWCQLFLTKLGDWKPTTIAGTNFSGGYRYPIHCRDGTRSYHRCGMLVLTLSSRGEFIDEDFTPKGMTNALFEEGTLRYCRGILIKALHIRMQCPCDRLSVTIWPCTYPSPSLSSYVQDCHRNHCYNILGQ